MLKFKEICWAGKAYTIARCGKAKTRQVRQQTNKQARKQIQFIIIFMLAGLQQQKDGPTCINFQAEQACGKA